MQVNFVPFNNSISSLKGCYPMPLSYAENDQQYEVINSGDGEVPGALNLKNIAPYIAYPFRLSLRLMST